MRALLNVIRHKYLGVGATVVMLLLLPVALFISQQPQDPRGVAKDATILSFSPMSSPTQPIIKNAGDEFFINLMVEPKNNDLLTTAEIEIKYDSDILKTSTSNPIIINQEYFPEVIKGPVFSDGKIEITVSIGSDFTKAIRTRTKVMTLNFTAVTPTIELTKISFDKNTALYNVSLENPDGKNVLSTTIPSYVQIK